MEKNTRERQVNKNEIIKKNHFQRKNFATHFQVRLLLIEKPTSKS